MSVEGTALCWNALLSTPPPPGVLQSSARVGTSSEGPALPAGQGSLSAFVAPTAEDAWLIVSPRGPSQLGKLRSGKLGAKELRGTAVSICSQPCFSPCAGMWLAFQDSLAWLLEAGPLSPS